LHLCHLLAFNDYQHGLYSMVAAFTYFHPLNFNDL